MKEDKQLIMDLLTQTLRETRMLDDLLDLVYDERREIVTATFRNGTTKTANVACDSGIAMIKDVLKALS